MPKASVVIPCYNAERFVEGTVRSVLGQTMADFEVVCVDDGSTDGTRAALEGLASEDSRVRVLAQENGGEGPARDAGLKAAQGTWIYCLDADDLMEPTLLEEAIACGEQTGADLVVFRTRLLDDQTGALSDFRWCFDTAWLPEGTTVFDPTAHPDHILNSFQNWVHNKLLRASFVHEHGLGFQHVHRTADLLFTCRALTEARRIALLDRPLHRYRVNNPQSALFTSDLYPLDFYEAFLELRRELERRGTWELYHLSYVNWAVEGVAGNLERARSPKSFALIADTMRAEGLERLDIPTLAREDSYNVTQWDVCQAIAETSGEELPLRLIRVLCEQGDRLGALIEQVVAERDRTVRERDAEIERLWRYNEDLRESVSFKTGRMLTAPLRAVRDLRRA